MADLEPQYASNTQERKRLAAEIERAIIQAIERIEYGSIEMVIHDGRVVQIECREKIRVAGEVAGRKDAIRQIR